MKRGTLKFKGDITLVGEPTMGNEKRVKFSANQDYDVILDPERMKTHFVDIDFIGIAWVAGVNPALFTFEPASIPETQSEL